MCNQGSLWTAPAERSADGAWLRSRTKALDDLFCLTIQSTASRAGPPSLLAAAVQKRLPPQGLASLAQHTDLA